MMTGASITLRPVADRDWDRELADIVTRPEDDGGIDLRAGAAVPGPTDAPLEERLERIGASVLRLVDQRLVALGDELRKQAKGTSAILQAHALDTETQLGALEDVIEALAKRVLAVEATLETVRGQLDEVRSALFR
jgi:hypothetical protein